MTVSPTSRSIDAHAGPCRRTVGARSRVPVYRGPTSTVVGATAVSPASLHATTYDDTSVAPGTWLLLPGHRDRTASARDRRPQPNRASPVRPSTSSTRRAPPPGSPHNGSAARARPHPTSLASAGFGAPAATADATGTAVFMRGSDGALWWRRILPSGPTPWSSLGGGLIGDPAPVATSSGIDVFVRGNDGSVYWKQITGTVASATPLGGFAALGGYSTSPPSVATIGATKYVARARWRRRAPTCRWSRPPRRRGAGSAATSRPTRRWRVTRSPAAASPCSPAAVTSPCTPSMSPPTARRPAGARWAVGSPPTPARASTARTPTSSPAATTGASTTGSTPTDGPAAGLDRTGRVRELRSACGVRRHPGPRPGPWWRQPAVLAGARVRRLDRAPGDHGPVRPCGHRRPLTAATGNVTPRWDRRPRSCRC